MKKFTASLQALLCILYFSPLIKCEAGSVRMLDGETYTGKVVLDDTAGFAGITVTTQNGETVKLDPTKVFEAIFPDLKPESFPRGVFLTNGSFIPGNVLSIEDPSVKLGPVTIPRDSIASIVFAPLPRETVYQIPKGKTGALFPNGDFFPGKVIDLKSKGAVVDSTLFGMRPFTPGTQIAALVLRDSQPVPARFEVSTKDGHLLLTNDLRTEPKTLTVMDSLLGPVKINAGDVTGIRAGSGRYQLLTDLAPVSSGPDTVSPLPAQGENTEVLTTPVNVPVTYPVPAGFTMFSCNVAVAEGASPDTRVIFAVYGNEKPIFKTSPIGPGSIAQTVHVNIGPVQRITLRVESAVKSSEAVSGKWIAPMLRRP